MSTKAFLITLFSLFLFISSDSVPGAYEYIMNEEIDYSILLEDERMIPISWSNFDISFEETIQKVVVFVSTKRNYLGKWSGAFGTSTTVKPEYWTMTEDMAQSFTKKTGAIVWNVDEKTASIIQMLFEGSLKFGVWWFDCNDFTIEKVVVFTSLYKGGYPWVEEKEEKAQVISPGVYKAKVGDAYLYKKLGADKMLPINWSQFDMIKNTTHVITRIDVTISTSAEKLGKCKVLSVLPLVLSQNIGISLKIWNNSSILKKVLLLGTSTVMLLLLFNLKLMDKLNLGFGGSIHNNLLSRAAQFTQNPNKKL